MTDEMTKFTPEYITKRRAEMQADERHDSDAQCTPDEFYELLDEIERLQSELTSRDAFIERLIEEGNLLAERVWEKWCWEWDDLVAKWEPR